MARTELVFTSPELADYLHCSQSSLRNWMARGIAPESFRLGDPHTGHHRFRQSAVDAWLAESELFAEESEVAPLLDLKTPELRQQRLDNPSSVPPYSLTSRGKAYYAVHKLDGHTVGWLTSQQTCKRLGVNQSTISRWRSKGVGPTWHRIKSGRVWYVESSVEEYANGSVTP